MFGKPQKALHLHLEEEKKNPKHIGCTYAVMEKYDGWFMYNDCINGEWGGIRSKTGRTLPSMKLYNDKFNEIDFPTVNIRLVFEAVIPDESGPRGYMEFKDCNGLFNQQQRALNNVILKVHDVIVEGRNLTFEQRYAILGKLFARWAYNEVDEWLHKVSVLDKTHYQHDWFSIYNDIVADGGEGVILKRSEGKYEPNKRNFNLMKIKCELTLDLIVVGLVEGEGKYAGTLGNLVVKSKDGTLNNVSGMTDAQRMEWWINPDSIKGKIVEVKAMKKLKDGKLREGRFKAVRHDKTEKDID